MPGTSDGNTLATSKTSVLQSGAGDEGNKENEVTKKGKGKQTDPNQVIRPAAGILSAR